MDLHNALTTLRRLADGIDPETGEIYPPDSPYQHPQTIRSLFTAIEHLEEVHKLLARSKKFPSRVGIKWTKAESSRLLHAYNSGLSIRELSQKHQRTTGAIRSQLQKLGILFDNPRTDISVTHIEDRQLNAENG